MSKYYINEYTNPKFDILNSDNSFIERIELEVPNLGGYAVEYKDEVLEYNLIDYSLYPVTLGYYMFFHISYENHSSLTNTKLIEKLKNYKKNNKKFLIYPYKNYDWINYPVVFTNFDFVLSKGLGGDYARNMKGIKMSLRTINLLKDDLNWIDPNCISYFGRTIPVLKGIKQVA